MSEPQSIKRRPRRWRWVLRFLLAVALFLLIASVSLWWKGQREATRGRAELDEVLAETDRLDPRWRWEQIHADLPPLPEAEDSMRVIHAAAKANGGWKPKDLWLDDDDLLDDHLPANRRFSDERLKRVRDLLKQREPAVELAVSLKGYPRGRGDYQIQLNVLNTLLKHVEHCREIVTLLKIDSERLLHDGKSEETTDRITAILHVAAALREDPFLISMLCRAAYRLQGVERVQRLLGMGVVSDASCHRLISHLTTECNENLLRTALRGERAGNHLLFDNLESGRLSLADFMVQATEDSNSKPDLMTRLTSILYAPRLYEDHAHLLRRYNSFLELAQQPMWEQQAEWEALDREFRALRSEMGKQFRMIYSLLLMPVGSKVAGATTRDRAMLSCAITALAAERFRLANKRWPKSLQELCPAYLPEVPLDPYTGEQLCYAVKDDGAVVYSVDPDGIDGGGAELRPPKGNATAPHDLGVRLWNPDRRGLPAEKPKDANGPP